MRSTGWFVWDAQVIVLFVIQDKIKVSRTIRRKWAVFLQNREKRLS